MRPARIVYVLDTLEISGGVKVVVEHAEALRDRGHDVRIVTRRGPDAWMSVGVPVEVVSSFDAENLPEADVHVVTWYTTVLPVVRASRARRIVHFCQGYEAPHPHLAGERPAIDEAYRQPIPKMVISPHLVEILAPRYPGPYHVLPQGIRLDPFAGAAGEAIGPRHPARIGVVGTFQAEMKGIPVALRAVNRLRADGRDVRLFRASPHHVTAEETALCPADRFDYRIPVADMPAWYAGLDLLLHPSFDAEGFPLPPIEAMASGVPVVLTRIPSFAVLPERAAVRVPPGDDEAMARESARLLDDAERWRAASAAGREAARLFSLERTVDVLERVLIPPEPRRRFWRRVFGREART